MASAHCQVDVMPLWTLASQTRGDGEKHKLQLLAKVVKSLKEDFLCSSTEPRSIDELIADVGETAVTADIKRFLVNEALPSNIRVTITEDQKYLYKPPLFCHDKASLLRCIKTYYKDVGGGILKDDIGDSLACGESYLKALVEDNAVTIVTRADKKEIVFFNDRHSSFHVNKSLKELYHSVTVTGRDEKNIEAYLRMNGLKPLMEGDDKSWKFNNTKSKSSREVKKSRAMQPRDNVHVVDQLENYGDGLEQRTSQLTTSTRHSHFITNPIRVHTIGPSKTKNEQKVKQKTIATKAAKSVAAKKSK